MGSTFPHPSQKKRRIRLKGRASRFSRLLSTKKEGGGQVEVGERENPGYLRKEERVFRGEKKGKVTRYYEEAQDIVYREETSRGLP